MALIDSPQPVNLQFTLFIRGVETWILPNAPKGWEGTLINQSRNIDFFGMFRKFTTKVDFVLDAAHLLRKEFYINGLAGQAQLQVSRFNASVWQYEQIYLGDVDFSTFKDSGSLDGYIVTCSIMEAGISAMVTAYKDVKYSIPLNVPEAITINMAGVPLQETATYSFAYQGTRHNYYFPGLNVIQNQRNSVNQSAYTMQYSQLAVPAFSTSPSFFFEAQIDGQLQITNVDPQLQLPIATGQIGGILYLAATGSHISMGLYNQNGTLLKTIVNEAMLGAVGSGAYGYSVNVNYLLNVSAGDRLFIYITGDDADNSIDIGTGSLFLKYNTISPPTQVLAHRPMYVFNYLMQQMYANLPASDDVPFPLLTQSYYLQQWAQLCITSGDAIRPGLTPVYIFPGYNLTAGTMYQVQAGSIVYNGTTYATNSAFIAVLGQALFTTTNGGYVLQAPDQAIRYYPGDDLFAGSQYQVIQDTVEYNGTAYGLGQIFTAITGVETFTSEAFGQVIETSASLVIKTSFSDFFTSYSAVLGCGFGIENGVAIFENRAYFMKGILQALDVGNVKTFALEVYTDLLGSQITVGFPDQTYDIINGIDEYNSTQTYQMPITRIQKLLNWVSVYRGDMYGEEFLRIQAGNTNATKGDSEVFFIKVQSTSVTQQYTGQTVWNTEGIEAFTSVQGTQAGSYAWNIDISPKENLLRQGDYLHSILSFYDGYEMLFTSALKSASLSVVRLDGTMVSESANVQISALDAPFFMPYMVTIGTKLPTNALAAIDEMPYGYIKFTQDGAQYTGFIMDMSVDEAKNSEQTFKLLLCASNNLNSLIH